MLSCFKFLTTRLDLKITQLLLIQQPFKKTGQSRLLKHVPYQETVIQRGHQLARREVAGTTEQDQVKRTHRVHVFLRKTNRLITQKWTQLSSKFTKYQILISPIFLFFFCNFK